MEGKRKVGATRDFALCSVLVYVSLLSVEAVYEQMLLLGSYSVGGRNAEQRGGAGGNTWGSECIGGQRVGRGGFIVAPVVWGIWRASEVALWKEYMASSSMEKVGYKRRVKVVCRSPCSRQDK